MWIIVDEYLIEELREDFDFLYEGNPPHDGEYAICKEIFDGHLVCQVIVPSLAVAVVTLNYMNGGSYDDYKKALDDVKKGKLEW